MLYVFRTLAFWRDWLACRRYERLLVDFQLPPRVRGSRLPDAFKAQRLELRRRRLQLELAFNLDRAMADSRQAGPEG